MPKFTSAVLIIVLFVPVVTIASEGLRAEDLDRVAELRQAAATADLIVLAKVVQKSAKWSEEQRYVTTNYALQTEEVVLDTKSAAAGPGLNIDLKFRGGVTDEVTDQFADTLELELDDEAVFFVNRDEEFARIVGGRQGVRIVRRDPVSGFPTVEIGPRPDNQINSDDGDGADSLSVAVGETVGLADFLRDLRSLTTASSIASQGAALRAPGTLQVSPSVNATLTSCLIRTVYPRFNDYFGPFFPTRRISGDREFAGHGPDVWVNASLGIRNYGSEIWMNWYMRARETTSDWTDYDGSGSTRLWSVCSYVCPERITRIISGPSSFSYRDYNHSYDYGKPSSGFVQVFAMKGDTSGTDVGNTTLDDTHMFVQVRELKFEVCPR